MAEIRVLQVVTYMGRGGIETMLMNYYRNMDKDKVQFDFLVHREFRADYDDEIESLGGNIYRLPNLVPWSLSYRKALDAFFREHQEYKIVHSHINSFSSIILKSAKKYGVPVRLAHSHIAHFDNLLKHLIKRHYGRTIPKYATDLFACGRKAGDWTFRGAEFRVLNNAVDVKHFEYDEKVAKKVLSELEISEDAFVVGHVGRFYEQKNHTFLIDIFNEIHQTNENSVLLLVGDGKLRPTIEAKVKSLGLEKCVIFTGVRGDVDMLYHAMDIFVMPSLFEGLPVVLVEAQAAGLRCVVSDKVSDECQITDLVSKISLEAPASQWAKSIIYKAANKRENTSETLREAGYDVVSNARWLQNYYLEKWNEEV